MPPLEEAGRLADRPGAVLNLLAGQVYFGHRASELRTLLGSCVGVTMWNAQRRLGGMCHFLLPSRARAAGQGLDARFGEEAFEMLVTSIRRAGTQPTDYEVHLYGGADTLPDSTGVKFNVGERNIETGWSLIERHGFALANVDVGDHVPRNVSLSLADGTVQMRRGANLKGRAA